MTVQPRNFNIVSLLCFFLFHTTFCIVFDNKNVQNSPKLVPFHVLFWLVLISYFFKMFTRTSKAKCMLCELWYTLFLSSQNFLARIMNLNSQNSPARMNWLKLRNAGIKNGGCHCLCLFKLISWQIEIWKQPLQLLFFFQ